MQTAHIATGGPALDLTVMVCGFVGLLLASLVIGAVAARLPRPIPNRDQRAESHGRSPTPSWLSLAAGTATVVLGATMGATHTGLWPLTAVQWGLLAIIQVDMAVDGWHWQQRRSGPRHAGDACI